MKIGAIPENLVERIVLATGRAPQPLLDTMIAMLLVRTIMVGTRCGVFGALAPAPLTDGEVADRCATHPGATVKLLNALTGAGYLTLREGRYALAPVARRWLLPDAPRSLHDNVLFRFMEWDLVEGYEEYVRTGKPVDVHKRLSDDGDWELYQRGMRSLAATSADEVAKRTPVPTGARDLLDIGGSHGFHSVVLCRRHPDLRAVVLDLPEAIRHAAPLLAREAMGSRVVHRAGDALTDDLGEEAWDVVFMGHLAHHFDADTNRALAARVARALRPGGVFVVHEVVRPRSPGEAGQPGALTDLYFALTSNGGTWSYDEIAGWQRAAGLVPRRPARFRSVPGTGQQAAVKPGRR